MIDPIEAMCDKLAWLCGWKPVYTYIEDQGFCWERGASRLPPGQHPFPVDDLSAIQAEWPIDWCFTLSDRLIRYSFQDRTEKGKLLEWWPVGRRFEAQDTSGLTEFKVRLYALIKIKEYQGEKA